MLNCPRCGIPAEHLRGHDGLLWHCPQCGGVSTIISQMRKYVPHHVVNALWLAAKRSQVARPLTCPSCYQKLAEIPVPDASFVIDVCPGCAFVWFDSGEYQLLPKALPQPVEKPLPPEIAQLLALRQIEDLRRTSWEEKDSPDEGWKYIPALMGVPVEFDADDLYCVPYVTWFLLLLIIVISLFGFFNVLPIETFGLIPAQWGRMAGLTLLTSFFLHGGLSHLLGNLYFLFVFGDNVEDVLGRWRFLFLLAVSTLAGHAAYVFAHADSSAICVGASGGISGILAYYVLRFPKHRMGVFLLRFWYLQFHCGWIRFPVTVYFAFWIFLQVIYQAVGLEHIAYEAHYGGLAAGVIFWLAEQWRKQCK